MLFALDELDAVIDQVRREVLDLLLGELDFLDPLDDLVVGEEAFLLSRRDELLQLFDVGKSNVDSEHLSTTSGFAWADGGTTETREPAPARPAHPLTRRTIHQVSRANRHKFLHPDAKPSLAGSMCYPRECSRRAARPRLSSSPRTAGPLRGLVAVLGEPQCGRTHRGVRGSSRRRTLGETVRVERRFVPRSATRSIVGRHPDAGDDSAPRVFVGRCVAAAAWRSGAPRHVGWVSYDRQAPARAELVAARFSTGCATGRRSWPTAAWDASCRGGAAAPLPGGGEPPRAGASSRCTSSFINAGAELIETNTFGANRRKLAQHYLEDEFEAINSAGGEARPRGARDHRPRGLHRRRRSGRSASTTRRDAVRRAGADPRGARRRPVHARDVLRPRRARGGDRGRRGRCRACRSWR